MTRPALIAAGCLSALADTMRGDPIPRGRGYVERLDAAAPAFALLASDRAAAVSALRTLPPASVEHPYPALIPHPGLTSTPNAWMLAVKADVATAQQLEDYADALRVWDREEQEIEGGEKVGAE